MEGDMKVLIPALALSVVLAGCSTTAIDNPEEQAGYFVDIHQSQARGGVGNYVDKYPPSRDQYFDHGEYHAERGQGPWSPTSTAALDQQAEDEIETSQAAPVAPVPVAPKALDDPKQLVSELRDDLTFETGSSELKPSAVQELQKLGDSLSQGESDIHLTLTGYADSTGTHEFNHRLSKERAASVREVLISRGVRPDQIEIHARGESKPVASNDTNAGRTQNRRVDINLG
jgi:outer membrane protein OmpA-like peptidoglycan-associated protein